MFGNTEILKLEEKLGFKLWGKDSFICFENTSKNKIYFTIENFVEIFDLEPFIKYKEGERILSLLPNYIRKGNNIILIPETHLIIPSFNYNDLDLNVLKLMHFGNVTLADYFIDIFGDSYLKSGDIIYKKINPEKIVEFWNKTDLQNPHLWGTIANYIIKYCYNIKRDLKDKNVKVTDFKDTVKYGFKHNKLVDNVRYYYVNGNRTHSDKPLSDTEIQYVLKKNSKLYVEKYSHNIWGEELSMLLRKHIHKGIDIRFYTTYAKVYISYKTYIRLEPVILCPQFIVHKDKLYLDKPDLFTINLTPVNSTLPDNFNVKKLDVTYSFNLELMACRCEYFKGYISSGFTRNITTVYDLSNLISFVYNVKADLSLDNFESELEIADYYICKKYTLYIKNWMIINAIERYYDMFLETNN